MDRFRSPRKKRPSRRDASSETPAQGPSTRTSSLQPARGQQDSSAGPSSAPPPRPPRSDHLYGAASPTTDGSQVPPNWPLGPRPLPAPQLLSAQQQRGTMPPRQPYQTGRQGEGPPTPTQASYNAQARAPQQIQRPPTAQAQARARPPSDGAGDDSPTLGPWQGPDPRVQPRYEPLYEEDDSDGSSASESEETRRHGRHRQVRR